MQAITLEHPTAHSPESLVEQLACEPGTVLLRSALFDTTQARFSFVTTRPFLTFRSWGSRCEIRFCGRVEVQFANPWSLLEGLLSRYELLDQQDLPLPLGGCFGYWGYELKNFVEPKLARRAVDDLELPDCVLGYYGSLVVFDHLLNKTWIISTGLKLDGSRTAEQQLRDYRFWQQRLGARNPALQDRLRKPSGSSRSLRAEACELNSDAFGQPATCNSQPATSLDPICSNLSRASFLQRVELCQSYIRSGDIYQVNLSQRLTGAWPFSGWDLFQVLSSVSPAPFAAYLDCGGFQLVSSSPELFLKLSGQQISTRPIKGTRPRSAEPTRDAQLTYELQTSGKEMAELVMITDLLRNDLGKVCQFGSVQVPELVRLERYSHVQHLVSTIQGRLRTGVTHSAALAACFPGGSITGAPKFRAMEIIDQLEPNTRGPYTGALGYLGFNRESQLSIIIRTAICFDGAAYFHVGAGIVADSVPGAEYEETLSKARGFIEALRLANPASPMEGEVIQLDHR